MTVIWTYEVALTTVLIAVAFAMCAYWIKDIKRIVFLMIGFLGFWLIAVRPQYSIEETKKSREIDNIQDFLNSEYAANTDTVILVGNNHQISDLSLVKDFHLKFKDPSEKGFIEISYPKVQEGQKLNIKGKLFSEIDSIDNIWIEIPGSKTIQAEIGLGGEFLIESIAAVQGLYEYKLKAKFISGDSISEVLPVEVTSPSKVSLLIIASAPGFELNYLKNYWVSLGHSVVQKIKISKDKYSTGFYNIGKFDFNSLSTNALSKFDMLYIDIPIWNGLSSNERNLILFEVENRGLGVIIKPTITGQTASGLPYQKLKQIKAEEINSVPITRFEYEYDSDWKSINNAKVSRKGYGKIILLEIDETYKLILTDQSVLYQKIWSDLLSELFVKLENGFKISTPFLSYEDQPIVVQFSYSSQVEKYVLNDIHPIKIIFTPFLEGFGKSTFYGKEGWNKITEIGTDESRWFYVHGMDSWKSLKNQKIKDYIAQLKVENEHSISANYESTNFIPWWISLSIMVLGFGMVWMLEKMT